MRWSLHRSNLFFQHIPQMLYQGGSQNLELFFFIIVFSWRKEYSCHKRVLLVCINVYIKTSTWMPGPNVSHQLTIRWTDRFYPLNTGKIFNFGDALPQSSIHHNLSIIKVRALHLSIFSTSNTSIFENCLIYHTPCQVTL